MEVRTALQTGDTQSLSGVQRQAVVAVLDVGLAGHGVEVGLQGELHQVAARLHLQQGSKHRRKQHVRLQREKTLHHTKF